VQSGVVIFPYFTVSCPPLTAPDNGMIDCTGSLFEDTCIFSCEADYNITGSESRTCQSDQTWSGSETMCTRGMLYNAICQSLECISNEEWFNF